MIDSHVRPMVSCRPWQLAMLRTARLNDHGAVQVDRGDRIHHSSAVGPFKGGPDFGPGGKSPGEVMRFCQALVCGLFRHVESHR